VVLIAIFATYVGSYYILSRRGMAEATAAGTTTHFYYVTVDQMVSDRKTAGITNVSLWCLYTPLNWIDRTFLGGMYAASNLPIMELSDIRENPYYETTSKLDG